jgi:tripartite ATP-independent transporter DctM subunit
MTEWVLGLIGIAVFFALMICGVRIAFSALISGLIVFFLVYNNLNTIGTALSGILFSESSNYAMTVIPLFTFMGYLALHYGIGTNIYDASRCWFGRLPGGLAIATITGCAFFGAICGVSPVAVAIFGKMAIPEMDRSNYHWSLSVGSVAASGTLADLIPPSTLMIIYGILTQESIGKILIAGFIPGLLSATIYCLMIIYRCMRDPRLGPKSPPTSFREKFRSLKGVIMVFVVMVIIVGGLYSGIFSPTEAGAVSAFVMLIASFIVQRGFHWAKLKAVILDTVRTSCMIFMLLIGIKVMTTALISTGVIGSIVEYFQGLAISGYLLLLMAMVLYVILGAFVGVMGMLVMTVPFIVPILTGVGFDPIWLGVIVIKFCEVGLITPPIGTNVFIIAQVTGRDVSECFRAITWFLVMDLLTIGILIAFPQIVLFLPSLMS